MNTVQKQVLEFHETFGAHIEARPAMPPRDVRILRLHLIYEEFLELAEAFGLVTELPEKLSFKRHIAPDLIKSADAIGDLLYVVYGGAVNCGIDMGPISDEIHASNMTKKDGHMNKAGKWCKPNNYRPPDLKPILENQGMLSENS